MATVNVPALFFATQNKGKQREIAELLKDIPNLDVVFVDDFPELAAFDPAEPGTTLHQNAELKARAFALETGLTTVAEDSGLEVTALDGKPGVHSKRFFTGSDDDRNQEILRLLRNKLDRTAQFRSVFSLYDPKTQKTVFFEGIVHGTISNERAGSSGFGFDPIFIPEGQTQTFAELGSAVKNQVSHRARAMAKIKQFLLEQ